MPDSVQQLTAQRNPEKMMRVKSHQRRHRDRNGTYKLVQVRSYIRSADKSRTPNIDDATSSVVRADPFAGNSAHQHLGEIRPAVRKQVKSFDEPVSHGWPTAQQVVSQSGISTAMVRLAETARCVVHVQQHSDLRQDFHCIDRGYMVRRYTFACKESGHQVGYMKLTTSHPDVVAAAIPGEIEFSEAIKGRSFRRDVRAVWVDMFAQSYSTPRRTLDDMPDCPQIAYNQIVEQVTSLPGCKDEDRQQYFRRLIDVPHVDYSQVYDDFRGQGFGKEMYLAVAADMAEQGRCFRSSGVQSDEAQALWERLVADPEVPTVKGFQWAGGERKTVWKIDMRGASS